MALPDSRLPTTQFSVNLVRAKVFRSKILTDPLHDAPVLRVTRFLKCFKKLSETGRPSAVLGWTISLSCYTNLPERFVSEQNLFKKKFVLPAVAKIVLVQQSRSRIADHVPKSCPVLINNSGPKSMSRIRVFLFLENELMKVGIRPPHNSLQGLVEIAERNIPMD
jgi:hypothetical protein